MVIWYAILYRTLRVQARCPAGRHAGQPRPQPLLKRARTSKGTRAVRVVATAPRTVTRGCFPRRNGCCHMLGSSGNCGEGTRRFHPDRCFVRNDGNCTPRVVSSEASARSTAEPTAASCQLSDNAAAPRGSMMLQFRTLAPRKRRPFRYGSGQSLPELTSNSNAVRPRTACGCWLRRGSSCRLSSTPLQWCVSPP
jgi:hypothetical protein